MDNMKVAEILRDLDLPHEVKKEIASVFAEEVYMKEGFIRKVFPVSEDIAEYYYESFDDWKKPNCFCSRCTGIDGSPEKIEEFAKHVWAEARMTKKEEQSDDRSKT